MRLDIAARLRHPARGLRSAGQPRDFGQRAFDLPAVEQAPDGRRSSAPARPQQRAGSLRSSAAARLADPGARAHLASYSSVIVFLWVIWAVTGFGFPWPVFPMFGWGIGVVMHLVAEPDEE